jgi:acyl-CoA thioester hydrolase
MTHPLIAQFPVAVEFDIAWGDMDSYAHVNNVVYFRYFENARIPYLDRIGWMRSREVVGLGPILASTSARFRKPLTYPDHVWVGVRTAEVLVDRVRIEYRIVSAKLDAVVADGEGVVVSYDYRAATKCPIPEAVRKAIDELDAKKAQGG